MIDASLYSINVPVAAWCLLGAMVLFMALSACLIWPKLWRVRRQVTSDNSAPLPTEGYPSASVIVYAQGAANNLRTLLPQILQQDYPAPMEVIVVNDETDDDTEDIVSELELYYQNLYMTFAPERSRSLSRRKLSITLGIKAARYGVVVLTDGNCRITSPVWLRSLTRHFITGAEVVLGYAELRAAEDCPSLSRRYSWDRTLESVRWLSAAICHKPIRGTSCNMAYTRQLFFDHKGFSNTLHLRYGDDDVFLHEIATGRNTAVELSDDSRVVIIESKPDQMARVERIRRDFTASMLPSKPYLTQSLSSLLWWLWMLCAVASSIVALPSLIPAAAAFVLSVTYCFIAMTQWRRTAVALADRPLFWTVPWLAWFRPWRTMVSRIRGRKMRKENLTHLI
ncbi:MAG: glycosyltransferase [Firmicutes bacterium]|nr:glycosyltransferase [Bacillota bacterium]MCM1401235.1 glycosyltransferase [Bacteroides sp.]MCM1477216.1 glycosyltransferase [Bacteroides sp.]